MSDANSVLHVRNNLLLHGIDLNYNPADVCGALRDSSHLLVQSQEWKHQIKLI